VKPSRPGECGFCSDNCRKSYHKHGGAYRKLKVEMLKLLNREMREIEKQLQEIAQAQIENALRTRGLWQ